MKAIIEIELEIDGMYKPNDDEILIDKIFENAGAGVWEIEEGRLLIYPRSMTCEIKKNRDDGIDRM